MPRWVARICYGTFFMLALVFAALLGPPKAYSGPPPVCTQDMTPCPVLNCCCPLRWTCVESFQECQEFCWPDQPVEPREE